MASLKTTVIVYNWVFKLIGAVLLIALALTLYLLEPLALVEAFVGMLIGGYALLRLIPFIRTQKSDLIKTINIVEIVLNLLIASVFIAAGFITEEGLGATFGYVLGGVLIGRGMVHFYGLSYGAEKGDHPTYFFHVATIVTGTLIISRGFKAEDILILVLILSIAAGAFMGIDAYGGYNQYRHRKQMEKPKEAEKMPEIDVPKKEDPAKDQDTIIS